MFVRRSEVPNRFSAFCQFSVLVACQRRKLCHTKVTLIVEPKTKKCVPCHIAGSIYILQILWLTLAYRLRLIWKKRGQTQIQVFCRMQTFSAECRLFLLNDLKTTVWVFFSLFYLEQTFFIIQTQELANRITIRATSKVLKFCGK